MAHDNISTVIQLKYGKSRKLFGNVAQIIDEAEGDLTSVEVIKETHEYTTREIIVKTDDEDHRDEIVHKIKEIDDLELLDAKDETFDLHIDGKIEVQSRLNVENHETLSRVYTPDVARVSKAIDNDPSEAMKYTIKHNTVAIVTDSSALLGLGEVEPKAGLPVMEGKAMLFKQMADIDAFPICLDVHDTEEIIQAVKAIAPSFGGINLEDIAGPQCFEVEQRLEEELDIPVFHDDQHGTAVVLMAGLLNALKVADKKLEDCKVVVTGIGAAGIACSKMLMHAGVGNLIGVDKDGALVEGKDYDNDRWNWYAEHTNPNKEEGELSDVIEDADVFIGVSAPNILKEEDVKTMADNPIVFAMANPTPEIPPEDAAPHVKVMATGRSDYPNQINNVLCFPGLFRGILDANATEVPMEMKMAAAEAIASVAEEDGIHEEYIIPDVFNDKVVPQIRDAIIEAASGSGRSPKE
ncbi:MAG TPA: NAD-dependent malic enzyme [Bacillales bacterium]